MTRDHHIHAREVLYPQTRSQYRLRTAERLLQVKARAAQGRFPTRDQWAVFGQEPSFATPSGTLKVKAHSEKATLRLGQHPSHKTHGSPCSDDFSHDHLLISPVLRRQLREAGVDREIRGLPNASDHAPAWIELAPGGSRRRPVRKAK